MSSAHVSNSRRLASSFFANKLATEDRNCVRFLWVKDVKKPASSQNDEDLKIFRYARVTFGVNCSPSILGMTVDYHLAKYDSSTAEKLKKAGYVDNFLIGAEEKSEVEKDILEARKNFQEAGWNFREIFTNAIKQLNAIPVDKLPIEARTTNLHSSAKQKILGIIWDTFYDALSLKLPVPKMTEEKQWTKRKVLATIAECFDPCGLISPALLKGKWLMQKLWEANLPWDNDLPEDLKKEWEEIATEYLNCSIIKIPRRVLSWKLTKQTNFQLCAFSDASDKH
uniref:Uncharacterized protein n=1 Tax=Meloidogyne enterolobii TaxID=390850 RepID=A0A6V7Y0Y2_MELEN|nr:unnamed protein product [Meloidogyne enterolobii]